MSTTDQSLVDKLKAKTPAKNNFPAMLQQFKSEIARALPKHLNPDRMARICLTAFRRTPKLGECDPKSVFAAVITASQLGLEPDTLGRAYLIPYGRECQFVPGWKGLVELMNRSGLGTAWTGAVYAGDEFDFMLGDSPHVRHVPSGEYKDEALRYVYAIGRPRGCEWPIVEVWTIDRVRAHRDKYNKVGKRHYSYDNMEMYGRKVVLLQTLKYMPLSPELGTTMELSHAAENKAGQGLTIEGALDGSWVPPASEEENDTTEQTLQDKIKAAAGKPPPQPDHTPTPAAAEAGTEPSATSGNIGADEGDAGAQEVAPPPIPEPGQAPSTRQRVKAPAGMVVE